MTGLYYYGARYYDPRDGIFLGVDRFAEKYPSLSPYQYVANNPIKHIDVNGDSSVVIIYGDSQTEYKSPTGEKFLLYDLHVYNDITYEQFYDKYLEGELPAPDYTTQIARDANDLVSKGQTVKHSSKRYGTNNETPPGLYYMFKDGTNGDAGGGSYKIYLGDKNGKKLIKFGGFKRSGIALHQYDPRDSQGCLTFCSGANTQPVTNLINAIPDLNDDTQPVHTVIMPRPVTRKSYSNSANGSVRFKGTTTIYTGGLIDPIIVKP